jgi:hypothetical protein
LMSSPELTQASFSSSRPLERPPVLACPEPQLPSGQALA